MPKEKEIDDLDFEEEVVCPNCGHSCEGETICPNCGAVVLEEEEDGDGFHEDEEI